MDKKSLRSKFKALRKTLTPDMIEMQSLAIANQLLTLDIWDKTYYHIFLPIERLQEVDTHDVLQILAGKDKEIVISKADFDSAQMTHYLLTDNTRIKPNEYGIPEPQNGLMVPADMIEVVFIPLLAFDIAGNRVGYGKGFYDVFLKQCNPETLKIGLSFFPPEAKINDLLELDVKMDYCVTPTKIYQF
jgi:5-formyltetrahydrofolate cyclo-ligase